MTSTISWSLIVNKKEANSRPEEDEDMSVYNPPSMNEIINYEMNTRPSVPSYAYLPSELSCNTDSDGKNDESELNENETHSTGWKKEAELKEELKKDDEDDDEDELFAEAYMNITTKKSPVKKSSPKSSPIRNSPIRNSPIKKSSPTKKVRMCKSVALNEKCRFGNKCFFAHNYKELEKQPCNFGENCRLVRISNNVVSNNGNKVCRFLHPYETDEMYKNRHT